MTGSNSPQVLMKPRTPTTATSFQCNPTSDHPSNTIAGTSIEITPNHQKTSATMTNSQHCTMALHPVNDITSTRDQHILYKTSAIAADLQDNPAPQHPQNPPLNSRPFSLKFDTFWTLCNRCRTRYEYQKFYLNRKLLCCHCHLPFTAIEMPTLSANVCRSRPCPAPFAASKFSRSVPASSTRPPEIATMVQSSGQCVRGPKEAVNMARSDNALEKNTAAPEKIDASSAFHAGSPRLKEEKSSIKRQIDSPKSTNKGCQMTIGGKSGRKRRLANLNGNFAAELVVFPSSKKPKDLKELSHAVICSILMEKARTEIIRELSHAGICSILMEKARTEIIRELNK